MIKNELIPPSSNSLGTFLPLRTKDRHYKFKWDTVLGYFVQSLYGQSSITTSFDEFEALCKARFSGKLDEPDFWFVLQDMYFRKDQVYKIAPELLAFKASKNDIDANSKKLGDMFLALLNGFTVKSDVKQRLNFIEQEIKSEFDRYRSEQKPKKNSGNEACPYLPYLTDKFQTDLSFLSKRPHYLVNNFDAVIRLYGFLYPAQLALNIKDWSNGEPSPKPCFFIIDNEKASEERSMVKSYGYSQLNEYLEYLFPYLVMNESIQDKQSVKPLWDLFQNLSAKDVEDLNAYGHAYAQDRNERKLYNINQGWQNSDNPKEVVNQLLDLSYKQFDKKVGRLTIYNDTAVKGVLQSLCSPFIQRRGRAGQVLTFNQDYLVLLTNLAIGERDKLRLHELIVEFENRGVFFDKQTQQNLVDFYERMGNVERMSDSGDAVYVRKTV